jgi:hypothetical protein
MAPTAEAGQGIWNRFVASCVKPAAAPHTRDMEALEVSNVSHILRYTGPNESSHHLDYLYPMFFSVFGLVLDNTNRDL